MGRWSHRPASAERLPGERPADGLAYALVVLAGIIRRLVGMRMRFGGFAMLESMRAATPNEAMAPVLVLTADTSVHTQRRANELGANALVTKPYEINEVSLRVAALLELRAHARAAFRAVPELHGHSTADVEELQLLEQLARTCVYRDRLGPGHTERVGWMAAGGSVVLRVHTSVSALGTLST